MSEPILELSGLTKVFPGGLKALDNVDLTIRTAVNICEFHYRTH